MAYLYLVVAIIAEVVATSALKASEEFSKLIPTIIMIGGYAIAFYCLSVVLKSIPVGITYALWSGIGIVLIALVGVFFFHQKLDIAAVIGISLIILGVIVINVFSNSIEH